MAKNDRKTPTGIRVFRDDNYLAICRAAEIRSREIYALIERQLAEFPTKVSEHKDRLGEGDLGSGSNASRAHVKIPVE